MIKHSWMLFLGAILLYLLPNYIKLSAGFTHHSWIRSPAAFVAGYLVLFHMLVQLLLLYRTLHQTRSAWKQRLTSSRRRGL